MLPCLSPEPVNLLGRGDWLKASQAPRCWGSGNDGRRESTGPGFPSGKPQGFFVFFRVTPSFPGQVVLETIQGLLTLLTPPSSQAMGTSRKAQQSRLANAHPILPKFLATALQRAPLSSENQGAASDPSLFFPGSPLQCTPPDPPMEKPRPIFQEHREKRHRDPGPNQKKTNREPPRRKGLPRSSEHRVGENLRSFGPVSSDARSPFDEKPHWGGGGGEKKTDTRKGGDKQESCPTTRPNQASTKTLGRKLCQPKPEKTSQ